MSELSSLVSGHGRRRQRQSVGYCPAQSENSMRNCFTRQACLFRPLLKGHNLAVMAEPGVIPPVVLLDFLIGPDAVVRAVRSIIVDALDSKPLRALAHIPQKVLKTVKPAVADKNTQRAVTAKRLSCRVVAPLLHMGPNAIGPRSSLPVSSVFFDAKGAVNVPVKAPAGFGPARLQYASPDDTIVPAGTAAKPLWNAGPVIVRAGKHRPAAKSLSGHIQKFRHWIASGFNYRVELTMPQNKSLVNMHGSGV